MVPELSVDRFVPLGGACNFRDLGGYATSDGRKVRWRSIYRSGSMTGLSEDDFAVLSGRGLRVICDLRSLSERTKAPTAWEQIDGLRYWCRDYDYSIGDLNRLIASGSATLADARQIMIDIYRRLPDEQEDAYRHLFAALAAEEFPLAFNCSAGKDRTGLAAALVLTAIGVPFETVVEDYELSNMAFDYREQAKSNNLGLSDDVVDALGGTHRDYLLAAWGQMSEDCGSVDGYIRDRLAVDDDMRAAIQAFLLE